MRRWHPEAVRAVERASITTQGILINLASFCAPIVDLASAWGATPPERRISFRRWADGKSPWRQIIVQEHGSYADLTKSYVEAVVGTVAARVNSVEMRNDPSRKRWFIADELPQAGKIPIRELFEVGRSRGVRCVVSCQDFAQLEEVHGPLFVRALTSMCGTLVVGQVSPGETAEQLCKNLGSREHERRNVSVSIDSAKRSETVSFSRESVPLYSPSELASRLGPTRVAKASSSLLSLTATRTSFSIRSSDFAARGELVPQRPGRSGSEARPRSRRARRAGRTSRKRLTRRPTLPATLHRQARLERGARLPDRAPFSRLPGSGP